MSCILSYFHTAVSLFTDSLHAHFPATQGNSVKQVHYYSICTLFVNTRIIALSSDFSLRISNKNTQNNDTF